MTRFVTLSTKEKMMRYGTAYAVMLMFVFCTACTQDKKDVSKENVRPELKDVITLASMKDAAGFRPVLKTGKGDLHFGGAQSVVFRSADGGQTWQDISAGLPENLQQDSFLANDQELYVSAGNSVYHRASSLTAPFWKPEAFPGKYNGIVPVKGGLVAYTTDGQFLKRIDGKSGWSPVYAGFREGEVRTVFESNGGAVFVGSENGIFKSTNSGKTWKQVYEGAWVAKLVELNGILMATSQKGIIRSADNGESWNVVVSEGGVGIAVEVINGGFAAITFNTTSLTRRMRTSYDGGTSWQLVDVGLPENSYVSSVTQVGGYLFCGHPDGIYRSSDMGKTWKLLFPSVENKVFNLSVSGNVLYALARPGGC